MLNYDEKAHLSTGNCQPQRNFWGFFGAQKCDHTIYCGSDGAFKNINTSYNPTKRTKWKSGGRSIPLTGSGVTIYCQDPKNYGNELMYKARMSGGRVDFHCIPN